MGVALSKSQRRRLAAQKAPIRTVRPDYAKRIMQETPRFQKAATNLKNYGVSKRAMHRMIDEL